MFGTKIGVRSEVNAVWDTQSVSLFIHPAAPTGLYLLGISDTGSSSSDRLTLLDNADEGTQVRVEGTAEESKDEDLKKCVVEKFEFLKPWIEAEGLDVLNTYRVKKAKATTWTMETNFEPKKYVEL